METSRRRKFWKCVKSVGAGAVLLFAHVGGRSSAEAVDLAQQIAELMSQGPSGKSGHRFVHAKGIVCAGTFKPSQEAATISRASHFRAGSTPVTVRFSAGGSDMGVPDSSPTTAPRGMAIRFMNGSGTDIVANSHNGFVVGTAEEFRDFLKALAGTDSSKPHPWPIETFLKEHPRAQKFVQDPKPAPASFATEFFYGNNAFIFVNANGQRQAGRYQLVPVAGAQYLSDPAAEAMSPSYLMEEFPGRVAKEPVKFRLILQLAAPGDKTVDSSVVWAEDRRKVDLGTISITSVASDNMGAER
ncbi:MAG TPA: catalase family peroxidase, partial [Bryobacteraceae bacterium]|nr:catalase family peroxidase [Bryobacteraceae bacterium]